MEKKYSPLAVLQESKLHLVVNDKPEDNHLEFYFSRK